MQSTTRSNPNGSFLSGSECCIYCAIHFITHLSGTLYIIIGVIVAIILLLLLVIVLIIICVIRTSHKRHKNTHCEYTAGNWFYCLIMGYCFIGGLFVSAPKCRDTVLASVRMSSKHTPGETSWTINQNASHTPKLQSGEKAHKPAQCRAEKR